jgi:hypothetical protein
MRWQETQQLCKNLVFFYCYLFTYARSLRNEAGESRTQTYTSRCRNMERRFEVLLSIRRTTIAGLTIPALATAGFLVCAVAVNRPNGTVSRKCASKQTIRCDFLYQ